MIVLKLLLLRLGSLVCTCVGAVFALLAIALMVPATLFIRCGDSLRERDADMLEELRRGR